GAPLRRGFPEAGLAPLSLAGVPRCAPLRSGHHPSESSAEVRWVGRRFPLHHRCFGNRLGEGLL
ncbi:MAG: hypothetical protein AVDCRST_MAG28-1160, partial [uncultured Rubrobacteraceae bacterium]